MFSRCLCCHKPFRQGRILPDVRHGDRIAYDPRRGRLWSVCDACARWNLVPAEDRGALAERLERIAKDQGTVLAATANISLIGLPRGELIRVGAAALAEKAWWRFGRKLRDRRQDFESPGRRLAGYAFGAVAAITDGMGIAGLSPLSGRGDSPLSQILRHRHFGWAAWHGERTCRHCGSVLRALRYDLSWWTYLLPASGARDDSYTSDGLRLGIPCPRCDPWTPEKVFLLYGEEAEGVLRRVLAYQHVAGAGERTIRGAVRAIEAAGSPALFRKDAADQRVTLWRLGRERSVALEIAVAEAADDKLASLEASALEFVWHREETLAQIIDDELTSPWRAAR